MSDDDQGDPRVQISVPADLFRQAHNHAKRAGWPSTSAWLRHLLTNWHGRKLKTQPQKQLSVRLDLKHRRRLDRLARITGVSRSQAFGLLIEQALQEDNQPSKNESKNKGKTPDPQPIAPTQPITRPEIPPLTAYEKWAALVLEAAHATPHRFPAGGSLAFIAGVLDELTRRLAPKDPAAFRSTVRQLLPQLQRHGLIGLSRADLPQAMDPNLVRQSETPYLTTAFHFVDLNA